MNMSPVPSPIFPFPLGPTAFVPKYSELSHRRREAHLYNPTTITQNIVPYQCKHSNPQPSNPSVLVYVLGHSAVHQNAVYRSSSQNHPLGSSITQFQVEIYLTASKCYNIILSKKDSAASSMLWNDLAGVVQSCLAGIPQAQHHGTLQGCLRVTDIPWVGIKKPQCLTVLGPRVKSVPCLYTQGVLSN